MEVIHVGLYGGKSIFGGREKPFKLGHHAGHCRGEMHKDKLKKGAV